MFLVLFFPFEPPKSVRISDLTTPAAVGPAPGRAEIIRAVHSSGPAVATAERCVSSPRWGLVGGVCVASSLLLVVGFKWPPARAEGPAGHCRVSSAVEPRGCGEFGKYLVAAAVLRCRSLHQEPRHSRSLVPSAGFWGGKGKSGSEKLSVPLEEQLSRRLSGRNAAVQRLHGCLPLPPSVRGVRLRVSLWLSPVAPVGPGRAQHRPSLGSVSSPVRVGWARCSTLWGALCSSGGSSGVGQQGKMLK